jgi:hypothetical protein
MSTQAEVAIDRLTADGGGLSFIDHDRQRYAEKVRLPGAGEILIGEYIEGGGTGPLGEFRIVLRDLGDRGGRLHPQLCLFGDGTRALEALLGLEGADLSALLAPVSGPVGLSRRLEALGLHDRSDRSLEDSDA